MRYNMPYTALSMSRVRSLSLSLLIWSAGLACHDLSGLAGKQALPAGTPDPSSFNTPAGALGLYQNVLYGFQAAASNPQTTIGSSYTAGGFGVFVDYVLTSGLLTDELQGGDFGGTQLDYSGFHRGNLIDARQLSEGTDNETTDGLFSELNGIRNSAGFAIGALATYDSAASPALRGQLYALQGYSELFLADLYCAGVPLSTLDYAGDFTYHAGSSTQEIYNAAIAKFDTAIALSGDSVRILNLARVGRGRALLDLGEYASAAAAVAAVPPEFSYQFLVDWSQNLLGIPGGVFSAFAVSSSNDGGVTVADREGTTGLPYLSSGDPRTQSSTWGSNVFGVPQFAPDKYGGAMPGITSITVADGIEARLIQAEAAYHGVAAGHGSWLDQLNALRQSAALPPVQDPGTSPGDTARIRLLFTERAYWLYLTGHRQGDLRRMVRQYGMSADMVYPTGSYPLFGSLSVYGGDITAPVPAAEHANPLFTGCRSRGA